jgi:hypothetical protein
LVFWLHSVNKNAPFYHVYNFTKKKKTQSKKEKKKKNLYRKNLYLQKQPVTAAGLPVREVGSGTSSQRTGSPQLGQGPGTTCG